MVPGSVRSTNGCYDPADFNDQLLLGLKGTMSQAELHFIRARLQGGKRNKARRNTSISDVKRTSLHRITSVFGRVLLFEGFEVVV
jgi:DNA invertase Pin-like site-specific DNA recombinase